jgi:hypothetical protein
MRYGERIQIQGVGQFEQTPPTETHVIPTLSAAMTEEPDDGQPLLGDRREY